MGPVEHMVPKMKKAPLPVRFIDWLCERYVSFADAVVAEHPLQGEIARLSAKVRADEAESRRLYPEHYRRADEELASEKARFSDM